MLTQTLLEQDSTGGFPAIVKKIRKNKKCGKGKGTLKKGGPRTCYKRGAEDHIAGACPVRLTGIAASGPERLPPDDPMKGGK